MRVQVICRNWRDDRIIPRMSRALADQLGWDLNAHFNARSRCEAVYLSGYFEAQRLRPWPKGGAGVAAYFTHREEQPPGNGKAKLFDGVAKQVDLRIATCRLYADLLGSNGPTVQVAAPLERERFTIRPSPRPSPTQRGEGVKRRRPVVGFSGYKYASGRKGEALAAELVRAPIGGRVEWRATGRGWPVATRRLRWEEMAGFYQGLDVLVCTSLVEGIPMPPLEALACGVRVVIPRGVGLLDELGDVAGIYRYKRGKVKGLIAAVERAAFPEEEIDREALRAVTEPYSVEAWVADHAQAFEMVFGDGLDAGIAELRPVAEAPAEITEGIGPVEQGTGSRRGIYCVAFGDPARKCALAMMRSAKKYMPDIPIALCAAKKIGPEDVLIVEPDSDVGGRRAKLKAYELTPAEWEAVLYLDADTEVVAPIYRFFEWIEDGWEFVICKDPHLMDTLHAFERRNNKAELAELEQAVRTLHTLQYNGGVWAFGRNERVARFFRRWQAEWERHAQRDQGALIKAMYTEPLKVWLLGNEWNTFPRYSRGIETAGLMHYPGRARRWRGLIPGRIDSPAAWAAVQSFEQRRRGKARSSRQR